MPLEPQPNPKAVRTTCPYCGVGCGVLAKPLADGAVAIGGDPDHPANFGRLCSKGLALGETVSLDDRLLHPLIQGKPTGWDTALDLVAQRFCEAITAYGPESVAFYVSGQLLTEDYYVANKLMKGFIGSANIDTNSRLCMASSVAGHKRAFGSDTVPGVYEDLELADLVVLVGSNLAWCHPVLFQRLVAAKEKHGTKIVVIDPRATATSEGADLHLALVPGSDVALFNGLLAHLVKTGGLDENYISAFTAEFGAAAAEVAGFDIAEVTRLTGLTAREIEAFFELFAATAKSVTVFSQGVNQSSAGTDKVNAIINCHMATGRIGRPGTGPFSVTGQPNAMGGREVGGMANMLAVHMELGELKHRGLVQSFWRSPRIAAKPGLKAVDLFDAVGDGRIKALWIMGTNPIVSMPDADRVRAALSACPFVVVSDATLHTDTTVYAHVLLPSLAWGEKDGTVTNSERCISRQRAFLSAPGESRADWWQMAEIGKRMGWVDSFDYCNAAEIFAEHAELSGVGNGGSRDFDISAHRSIARTDYDDLQPFQWPQPANSQPAVTRFFAEGGFFTPDRRGRFIATPFRPPMAETSSRFPFVLNTGRVRDQWHTMTRTGKSARLMAHIAEPFVEIHPLDAHKADIADAELAIVESRHGRIIVRALVTERQRRGTVFVPMHWTDIQASAARVGALIASETDPVSGQPELKAMPVTMRQFDAAWYAFAVAREKPDRISADYWAVAPAKHGWRMEMAGHSAQSDWRSWFETQFPRAAAPRASIQTYNDSATGQFRIALFDGSELAAALFVASIPVAVSRSFAAEALGRKFEDPRVQFALLAGRPGQAEPDRGAIVCSCFEVGHNQIVRAIATNRCETVSAVGAALQAGTNCGSCRPEIAQIISVQRAQLVS